MWSRWYNQRTQRTGRLWRGHGRFAHRTGSVGMTFCRADIARSLVAFDTGYCCLKPVWAFSIRDISGYC